MKLISYVHGRESSTMLTDSTVYEWITWYNDHVGRNPGVTYVAEISAAEAQRWQAETRPTILRRDM